MTQLSTPTSTATGKPPVVDAQTWRAELDELRKREKAATRELDAIAAQRRRLPMVELPDYTLIGADGPVRLADVFDGRSQLIVYHHMWSDGAEWQCGGCTGLHLAVHPAGIPGQLRRPLRHRHQRPDRRGAGLPRQGRQPDGLVLVVGEPVRRRRRRAAQRGLRASTSSCATLRRTPCTAPGTPTVAAPSSSATRSR